MLVPGRALLPKTENMIFFIFVMLTKKPPGFSWPCVRSHHCPPRSKGRGHRVHLLLGIGGIPAEEEHVGWDIVWTSLLIFGIYRLPHIGSQQQGLLSCSYKVCCGSGQFSRANVLLLASQCKLLLPSCSFSVSTPDPTPMAAGEGQREDHIPSLRYHHLEGT